MKRLRLVCVLLFLTSVSGLAHAELGAALRAIERGHYPTAERALRKPAASASSTCRIEICCVISSATATATDYKDISCCDASWRGPTTRANCRKSCDGVARSRSCICAWSTRAQSD